MTLHATPEGMDACSPDVAGRIDAAGHDLSKAVDAWLAHLASLGKTKNTVSSFRQVVHSAARARGWMFVEDLTAAAVIAYMDSQRAAGLWGGSTYNRNLSCFRSLEKFIARTRDPHASLRQADRADSDGEIGSRAASDAEALAMVRRASVFLESGRTEVNRPLERLMLFAAACRAAEPERLRWRHVNLDAPVPYIRWTPDVQKNKREQLVALAPELVEALAAHREAMRQQARRAAVITKRVKGGSVRKRGVSPDDPDAFVLPVVSGKGTWEADRVALGIPAEDALGQAFTRHSARKWFSTRMTAIGVPEKMVDYLMRHRGRVEHRYYQPSLEEQREQLAKLPRLMASASVWATCGQARGSSLVVGRDLTNERGTADHGVATPGARPTDSIGPPAPPARYPESRLGPCWAAGPVESTSEPGGHAWAGRRDESASPNPVMPRVGLEPTTSGL